MGLRDLDMATIKENIAYAYVFGQSCKTIDTYLQSMRKSGDSPNPEMVTKGRECMTATKEGVNAHCSDAFNAFLNCKSKECIPLRKALLKCAKENNVGSGFD